MNVLKIRKSRTGCKILLEVKNRAGVKGYTESISLCKSCIAVSIKIYKGKQRYTIHKVTVPGIPRFIAPEGEEPKGLVV